LVSGREGPIDNSFFAKPHLPPKRQSLQIKIDQATHHSPMSLQGTTSHLDPILPSSLESGVVIQIVWIFFGDGRYCYSYIVSAMLLAWCWLLGGVLARTKNESFVCVASGSEFHVDKSTSVWGP
jgi:hypothetical protein